MTYIIVTGFAEEKGKKEKEKKTETGMTVTVLAF